MILWEFLNLVNFIYINLKNKIYHKMLGAKVFGVENKIKTKFKDVAGLDEAK